MKNLFIIAVLTGFMIGTNSAVAAPALTPQSTSQDAPLATTTQCDAPKDFIDSLNDKVVNVVTDKKLSDEDRTKILSDMFRSYVNIQWIGRFVLAQNWRSLKPAQQTQYLKAYEDYLLRTYIPIFKEYKGQKVEFISATPLRNPAEYMVATRILSAGEPEVQVSYRIKKDAACFKIYDIVAEGVSMLNTQRQDFSSIFSRKGYSELINILKSKIADKKAANK